MFHDSMTIEFLGVDTGHVNCLFCGRAGFRDWWEYVPGHDGKMSASLRCGCGKVDSGRIAAVSSKFPSEEKIRLVQKVLVDLWNNHHYSYRTVPVYEEWKILWDLSVSEVVLLIGE